MGATNHTPNLKLPQFIGTDKPTWLGDVNNAFSNIDAGFGDLQVVTSSVISGQIKDLQDTVALHTDGILENAKDIAINTASIGAMATHLSVLDADLETLDKRERSHFATLQNNIDLNNKSVQDIEDDNVYIKKNMDKIESDVIIATASIAAYKVQVDNLDKKVDTFDSRINDNATDIANLQAETDVLIQRADTADTDISVLQQKGIVTTSSIANLDSRVTVLETLPTEVANLKQDVDDNTANIVDLGNLTSGHTTAIQDLQTKTNGITDGVTVPFGFGIDASGNRGYRQPDNSIQPFFTNREWQDLQKVIDDNTTDIADLQVKTAGITDGMTLPYSLAIAPGGAYGYKKNGEQGVTPFVTEEDVNKIVDLEPLEADVQNLQTKTSNIVSGAKLERNVENNNNNPKLQTGNGSLTLSVQDANAYSLHVGGPASDKNIVLPFSLGVDAQGNYGYIKAGADTVTPFKSSNVLTPDLDAKSLGFINPPTANIDGAIGCTISDIYVVEQIFFEFYLTSSGIQGYPRNISIIGNNGNITFNTASYEEFQNLDDSTGVKLYTDNLAHQPSSVNSGNSNMMFLCALNVSTGKYRILHGLVHITDGSDTIAWWLM